jgi:hypothetical protein
MWISCIGFLVALVEVLQARSILTRKGIDDHRVTLSPERFRYHQTVLLAVCSRWRAALVGRPAVPIVFHACL